MRIGAVGSIWSGAAQAKGCGFVSISSPIDAMPAPQPDPMASRLRDGARLFAQLTENPVDLIVDSNTEGLAFVPCAGGRAELLHEKLGVTLVSHLVDPLLSCMRGLSLAVTWQVLQSRSWKKLAFERTMALELAAFGIPGIEYMPQAAPDSISAYDFTAHPLDLSKIDCPVAFSGTQSSNYFGPSGLHEGDRQFIGALALARKAECPDALFYDSYHNRYHAADPVRPSDTPEQRATKLCSYYDHKLFYIAMLWIAQRNRFVRFLANRLGSDFRVQGRNWESQGVTAAKPIPGHADFIRSFRTTLININLNNGNTETGLNQRAFEITAAGGFLLCAHSKELGECFRIGEECDVFHDEDELLEKIAFYRARPARVAEVAWAGRQRTLREHLFSHRLASIASRQAQPTLAA